MRMTILFSLLTATAAAQKIDNFTFELDKLGGGKVRAQDFAENVLIVDLWGTWCPPCREAVPHLQRMYAKYKHHGLEIVGLNYEGSGSQREQAERVRKFASEKGLTYHLALGTPAEQRLIPDFRGYPTILFFHKGLQFDHLMVGFEPGSEVEIERWVATELGLPTDDLPTAKPVAPPPPEPQEAEGEPGEEVVEEDVDIPAGAIYKPGQGDTGFDFEALDVDGGKLRFKELGGKPVVLALTTTWDSEAVNTAKLIERIRVELGERAHVIAASFERSKDPAVKDVAIKEFMKKNSVSYRAFAASMGLQKKIYLFTGIPLFLVFDAEGKLILREASGTQDELFAAVVGAIQ
ncbi:MAG: redoxin domain-containing protein [Planctomycetota bacterium]